MENNNDNRSLRFKESFDKIFAVKDGYMTFTVDTKDFDKDSSIKISMTVKYWNNLLKSFEEQGIQFGGIYININNDERRINTVPEGES